MRMFNEPQLDTDAAMTTVSLCSQIWALIKPLSEIIISFLMKVTVMSSKRSHRNTYCVDGSQDSPPLNLVLSENQIKGSFCGHQEKASKCFLKSFIANDFLSRIYYNPQTNTIRLALLNSSALKYTWLRHQMETFSALLVLCEGNPPVTYGFPSQRLVTRSLDVSVDLSLNKRLSKQTRWWWFETPSCSLLRHCNADNDMNRYHRNGCLISLEM